MFVTCARVALIGGALLAGVVAAEIPAKIDFRKDIQPIFRANCYGCHGPTVQRNSFRLDRRRDAMRGGTLPQIGPGNSAGSRLYLRVAGTESGMQMPPTGPLNPEQIEKIKHWIDQGAEWPDDVSGETPAAPPDAGATRLMTALRNGDTPGFRKSLAEQPKAARMKGPGGSTPLMYATLYADTAAMRLLLDKDADPNAANDAGATPLMWAVDSLEKTKLLLERGAKVNARSEDGRTPLMTASGIRGNIAIVKLLLDRGAEINVKAPSLFSEATPLTEAALVGDGEIIRTLVQHGADPKDSGPIGLALAMRSRCDSCLGPFLKEPLPQIVNPAAFIVSPPLGPALGVKPLLDYGVDAHAKDERGAGLLVYAAASEAFPVDGIKAMLERGADVNAATPDGQTALDWARRHGNTPVVDVLLKAGAKEGAPDTTPAPQPSPAANIRAAVQRTLPLLQSNDATFLNRSGCVSCHNNTLTATTVATAKKSGFRVDEREVQEQLKTIGAYVDSWRERSLQNHGIPGDADTLAEIMVGLASANYPPDAATDAMAIFIKRKQSPDGNWMIFAHRPPLESSDFQVTAASVRALQVYAPKTRRAEFDQAIAAAGAWFAKAQPLSNEDRAFRLLGLALTGADRELIRKAAFEVASGQRPDGGWSQLPTLPSDAFATGQALVALQQSGAMKPGDDICRRGIEFLMKTQTADGSWYVRRRAIPIQPFFESGFPYGRDQFISASATNWATTALALAAR